MSGVPDARATTRPAGAEPGASLVLAVGTATGTVNAALCSRTAAASIHGSASTACGQLPHPGERAAGDEAAAAGARRRRGVRPDRAIRAVFLP